MNNNHKPSGECAQQSDEHDINEAFEKLLFAEDCAKELGYKEGYDAGTNQVVKGYHLGYHRASLLAARLGYYYGIVQYCLNDTLFNEKVTRLANKIREDLESFPRSNLDSVDILQKVDDIKFKYNKLCSLAKIDSTYPEVENLDY